MKNIATTFIICFVIIFSDRSALAMAKKETFDSNSPMLTIKVPFELDDTCIDEYSLRNKYLKKFITWAPPTVIVSLPVGSFIYLFGVYSLLTIAPYEILFVAGYGLWYLGVPLIAGAAITFEIKYTIEYFGNRSVVRVIDALRMGNFKDKHAQRFLKKFRNKHPDSTLTNEQIFTEMLLLDQKGSLCNGELTGSSSDKIGKLLAKNKHLYKYLGTL